MKIYHNIFDFSTQKKTVVTLGTFDGVHLGHTKILEKLNSNPNAETLVLTFFPHPRMVLQQGDFKLINTLDEKAQLLAKTGLQNLIIHPFSQEFSEMSAEDFVTKVLVETFNIQKIIIGYDHRFGKKRAADINDLIVFGKKYNFEVEQIEAQEINDISISSTKIRNAINEGEIELANKYLGYHFFFTGIVVEGKKLGRTINFPTANISLSENYKLVPAQGVYIVKSEIKGKVLHGMMNIGTNPTVGENHQTIEVHFLNFNENIYNQEIQISVLKKIRHQEKFSSLDALKQQLEQDRDVTENYFKLND
ncbi:bifunctional riboflavin kinase/FAD synthetase [Flavobacterium sp. NST-5]|uniref:Riboflavin biosynthesis protein n=1 Tax=Flavobacterium ichthyis TaxID=2698827 RepID=A0ABW9ZA78_9FLAO|nr:bifunctional riboflavin kinase/FAD synthetase [Flavobacterium ichthyis]NBL64684.1 bifunctional riboflavin kinase/FAD synthetase [Flavobacterium ichthyis]